ncbi:WPE palindromic element domain-containing protein [Wolbachia endosymbiont (group A) of Pogonocherus hispidulus]
MGLPGGCHSPVIQVADTGSFMKVSSQCPDYLDPENLTLNKWLHNKDWMPVSSTGMTPLLGSFSINV